MFTVCGQHVVLEVKSVQLMQMGNVLQCYLLNFVVLPTENQTHEPEGIDININYSKWKHIWGCWDTLQTCRESWRVCPDSSAGNSMRSTPAQSTTHSAVQLHFEGHTIGSSSSSSSALIRVWEIPITKAKSSTLMVCRTEYLVEAIVTH